MNVQDIVGGTKSWRIDKWQAVTDQVRGGKSFCTLETDPNGRTALFRGSIDPSLLGAAFASERIDIISGDGQEVGLELVISDGDSRPYSLNIYTSTVSNPISYKVEYLPSIRPLDRSSLFLKESNQCIDRDGTSFKRRIVVDQLIMPQNCVPKI